MTSDSARSEKPGRPPIEQWWTINGQEMLDALKRAHEGTDPDLVYLELHANSEGYDYGDPDEDRPEPPW